MTYAYTKGSNVTTDTFFASLGAYMSHFNTFADAGAHGYFIVVSIGPGQYLFIMMPMWGPNMTKPQGMPTRLEESARGDAVTRASGCMSGCVAGVYRLGSQKPSQRAIRFRLADRLP